MLLSKSPFFKIYNSSVIKYFRQLEGKLSISQKKNSSRKSKFAIFCDEDLKFFCFLSKKSEIAFKKIKRKCNLDLKSNLISIEIVEDDNDFPVDG